MRRVVCWVGIALLSGSAGTGWCDEMEIQLPNRTFEPAPGVEPALRDRLADLTQTAGVQAIVQLVHPPSPQDRHKLRAAGVELGPYVGGVAFIARIRSGSNPDAIPGLRWTGLLLPQDKISEQLWSLAKQDPGGMGVLLVAVHFQADVTPEAVSAAIDSFPGREQTYGTMSVRALRIPRSALELLAMQPAVRWLESISDVAFPLPAP